MNKVEELTDAKHKSSTREARIKYENEEFSTSEVREKCEVRENYKRTRNIVREKNKANTREVRESY